MQKRSLGSVIGGTVLGLFVAAIGLVFCIALFNGWLRAEETRKWVLADAIITHSELREGQFSPTSPQTFSYHIEYTYVVDGKGYQSEQVKRVNKKSSHRHRIEKYVERYPVGKATEAFVNPNDPTKSVLEHDTRAVLYTIWFPGLFVVAGLGIAVASLKR
ncbi:MAG: DUF3592 domain-containing protein [Verrucomicrobiota bacterium]